MINWTICGNKLSSLNTLIFLMPFINHLDLMWREIALLSVFFWEPYSKSNTHTGGTRDVFSIIYWLFLPESFISQLNE